LVPPHSGGQPSSEKIRIPSLNVEKPKVKAKTDAVTHAGGAVFRQTTSDEPEYLLVQATKKRSEWVLPKGHIEAGEDARTCAVREVREETGVLGRIKKELNVIHYLVENQTVKVQFYLMEAVEQAKPKDRSRKHAWLRLDEALHRATHDETKDLLRMAEQKRTEP